MKYSIVRKSFGELKSNEVTLFTLTNGIIDVSITNYGGIITEIATPDRYNNKKNIVASLPSLEEYIKDDLYLGCIVGRFANRISEGRFTLNGKEYLLSRNDGKNHLHGGFNGFHKKLWKAEQEICTAEHCGVVLSYISKDGEEGYPGNLEVKCTYLLEGEDRLGIYMEAKTDQPTIINLTNHTYFNLTGFDEATVYNHQLQIFADRYTEKDDDHLPTGEIVSLRNSILDFSRPRPIGDHIHELGADMGYNHNYILRKDDAVLSKAACLKDPYSGRKVDIITNQPGLQLYTANWWDGTVKGAQGKHYLQHGAVALEAQAFPDSPNHEGFTNTVLKQGERYKAATVFQFYNDK